MSCASARCILLTVALVALAAAESGAGGVTGVQVTPTVLQPNGTSSVTITGALPCGSVQIDFGDGEKKDVPRVAFPVTAQHTFQKTGTFTVTAKGTAGCAGQSSAIVTVKVPTSAPTPASATPFQPKTITVATTLTATGTRFQPKTIEVSTPLTATGTRFQPKTISVTTTLTATGTRFQPMTITVTTPLTATGTRQ
jgi:hypothetical protein